MFKHVDHGWRVCASGLGFCTFSLGGLAISLTVFPLIMIFVRGREQREVLARETIRQLFRLFVKFLVALRIFDVEIKNIEKLDDCRGTVVIGNHPTLIDIILIISILPNAQCIVKNALWRSPFLGLVVRAAGYIRNDDNPEKLLVDCLGSLKNGSNLVIFPEGTRTIFNRNNHFQRGFANIAVRAGADIQCTIIDCVPMMLAKRMAWYELPQDRSRFTLEVGKRLDISSYRACRSTSIGARKLASSLEETYAGRLYYGQS